MIVFLLLGKNKQKDTPTPPMLIFFLFNPLLLMNTQPVPEQSK